MDTFDEEYLDLEKYQEYSFFRNVLQCNLDNRGHIFLILPFSIQMTLANRRIVLIGEQGMSFGYDLHI